MGAARSSSAYANGAFVSPCPTVSSHSRSGYCNPALVRSVSYRQLHVLFDLLRTTSSCASPTIRHNLSFWRHISVWRRRTLSRRTFGASSAPPADLTERSSIFDKPKARKIFDNRRPGRTLVKPPVCGLIFSESQSPLCRSNQKRRKQTEINCGRT